LFIYLIIIVLFLFIYLFLLNLILFLLNFKVFVRKGGETNKGGCKDIDYKAKLNFPSHPISKFVLRVLFIPWNITLKEMESIFAKFHFRIRFLQIFPPKSLFESDVLGMIHFETEKKRNRAMFIQQEDENAYCLRREEGVSIVKLDFLATASKYTAPPLTLEKREK
jgi:hypothetical protein